MFRRFFTAVALVALAACSLRGGSSLVPVPAAPAFLSPEKADADPHAPCAFRSGLRSPVAGRPVVANAFGELLSGSGKTLYAYSGVDFTYAKNKNVFAATGGSATYDPKRKQLIVKSSTGTETLYAPLSRVKLKLVDNKARVKAGYAMAVSAGPLLRFAYAPGGNVLKTSDRGNPCGSGNAGSSATISVMPSNVAVYARFHTLSVNGVPVSPGPLPAGSPDVATPSTLTVADVTNPGATVVAPAVYERSIASSSYYVVLCGNAAFATGPARYAGPFTYDQSDSGQATLAVPSPLPRVVFFRDPGNQSKALTAPLPLPSGQTDSAACPAAPPADFYNKFSLVFNEVGQTYWVYYWCSETPDNITLSSGNASVVTASPSPLSEYGSSQPDWPPPANHALFTATGTGNAQITASDQYCTAPYPNGNDSPIAVQVNATPSPAPAPTAMSN